MYLADLIEVRRDNSLQKYIATFLKATIIKNTHLKYEQAH